MTARPFAAAAVAASSSPLRRSATNADRRDAGRLTRSSRRAAAQPKASCRRVSMPDHAVRRVDRLVDGGAGNSANRKP